MSRESAGIEGRGRSSWPKTERGIRTLPLSDATADLLRAVKARQDVERTLAGSAWEENGLVFCTSRGTPYSPRDVQGAFYKARDKAKVPRYGFHSLRHTKDTLAKLAGVDIAEIAADLGHESPSFTTKTYAHVVHWSQRAAAKRFEDFISGS